MIRDYVFRISEEEPILNFYNFYLELFLTADMIEYFFIRYLFVYYIIYFIFI